MSGCCRKAGNHFELPSEWSRSDVQHKYVADDMYRRGECKGIGRVVIMTPHVRRLLAFLSACGIATSILAYAESFSGVHVDSVFRWSIVLVPGWMALFAPIYFLEYPASRAPSFAWEGFARGLPRWVAPSAKLLSLIAIMHVLWCVVQNGLGTPAIIDGQYVLDSRGRILKVLTQAEYFKLRGTGVRTFAAMAISFYFMPMMYWWFPRSREQAD